MDLRNSHDESGESRLLSQQELGHSWNIILPGVSLLGMSALVFQGSPFHVLVSKAGTELSSRTQNVFPYKRYGSWLSLGVAVTILEPGNLARGVCCCEVALGHSCPEVLGQKSDITNSIITVGSALILLWKVP